MRAPALQQLASHVGERRGAARGHVEAPEELLTRRVDRLLQPNEVLRRGVGLVGSGGTAYELHWDAVVARQHIEEFGSRALVERLIGGKRIARERDARVFAAFGKKRGRERKQVLGAPVDAGAPAAADQL